MKILGNALAGGTYTDHTPDLPRATTLGHGHRPWCTDCKRKHDPDQLDTAQRCQQCARAAVVRAEAAERRAADPEAQRVWDEAARGQRPKYGAGTKAVRRGPAPAFDVDEAMRRFAAGEPAPTIAAGLGCQATQIYSHASKRGIKAGQDKPARPTLSLQADLNQLEATDPDVAAASASYDDMVDRITRPAEHIQAPAETNPALASLHAARAVLDRNLTAAAQALVDLDRVIASLTATPPEPAAADEPPAGFQVHQRTSRRDKIYLPTDQIVAAYQAGRTMTQIAADHGVSHPVIGRHLEAAGIPRRGSPIKVTPHLIDQVRNLYVDDELTIDQVADRLDLTHKVVAGIMRRHNIPRRPGAHVSGLRPGSDHAVALKQQIADLGVTSRAIKAWALDRGLVDAIKRGVPSQSLVDAYTAAHPQEAAS